MIRNDNGIVTDIETVFNDYLTVRCVFDYEKEKVVIASRVVPDEVLQSYDVLKLTPKQKGELYKVCRGIFEASFKEKSNPAQLDLFLNT
ncbi:hypothetical protein ISS06_02180 [Patescibacteria group bacterium]|nr:hypothetical protein [Patescibacteria group bacterium]